MSEGLNLITSLVDRGSTSAFRLLTRELFVGEEELLAYDFVRNHYRRYSEIPVIETVERDLDLDLPTAPESVDYYLQRVHNRSMFNAVRPIFNDLRDSLVEADSDSVRAQAQALHAACRHTSATNDLENIGEVGQEVLDLYDANHLCGGLTGIPSGWGTMDRETGGYQNGDLVTWVARPSVGKTHLTVHQAKSAWMHGASVLFVSMEMTLKQIGNRFYGQYSGINPDCIRKGQLSHWTYRRFRDAVRTLDGSNRFNLYAGNMGKTVDDVDILIQELAPDIVFIDGMYLMKPSGLKGNVGRYERIAYVLDELKTVTLVRDRPLITTTQFGKGAGKGGKGGDLENIGYTDTIATHSSIVMGIKMPAGDKSKYPKTREIDMLKGREGEQADFNINYTFAPVDFSERVGEKPFRQQSETPEANMDWMG